MRILLLSNLYPPHVGGGAEILAGAIADELEQMGHEVVVLTSTGEGRAPASTPAVQRTLRLAPPVVFDRRRPLWRQLGQPYHYYQRYHSRANARELVRVVASTQPDVLYIWEITGLGVSSLLRTLPMLDVPIVFHLGSYWLLYALAPETAHSRLRARWLKRALIGPLPALTWTSLIAVSATVKQEYVGAGYAAERIEVIYNGVGTRFLGLVGASEQVTPVPEIDSGAESATQLLFVGRLCREKGVMTVLAALDLLLHGAGHEPGTAADGQPTGIGCGSLQLHVVGNGELGYEAELRAYVQQRRLTEVVIFHGSVPQDKLVTYYDQADIMLVPSLWKEPFGLVTVEAMARGLAVIASRVGGSAEIITDGVNGLLVDPGDAPALALAIRGLAVDSGRRRRLGRCARESARERFSIAENAQRISEHLQRAVQVDARVGASR